MSEPRRTPLYDLHRELGGKHGAVRRLGDAGPVPGRHPGRAPALPRRRRPVRRLAHGPGPARRRRCRGGAGAAGAGRHPGPGAGPRALHAVHQRDGRHPRRPDRQPTPATICSWSSMPAAATPTSPICAPALEPAIRVTELADRGAAGAAGARGRRRSWPRLAPGLRRAAASWARPRWTSAACPAASRAWATPARTASRSRSPADDAEQLARPLLGRRRGARRPGWVRATRCGWRPGLPLYGHDIDTTTSPVEAGLAWSIAQAPPRSRAASPVPTAILRQLRRGRRPPAGRHAGPRAGRPPARAPRSRPPTARRSARSPAAASAPRSAGRWPWAMSQAALAAPGTELVLHGARQAPAGARRRPALRPAPLPPLSRRPAMAIYYTKDHEWVRIEGDIATVGISEHAQEQLGDVVFVELPEVGRGVAKGEQAAVVESVKAASEIYAPIGGEVTEGNAGAGRGSGAGQPGGRGRRLVLQAQASRCRRGRGPDGPRRLRRLPREHRLTMPSPTRIEDRDPRPVRRPPYRARARPSWPRCWRSSAPARWPS